MQEKSKYQQLLKSKISYFDPNHDLELPELSGKVVFTNGCFDILHQGHVEYLAASADLGDSLVIGVNSDESVRALNKGPERPINSEQSRAIVLAALGFVKAVVVFNDNNPFDLIQAIKPDVLVKGGDYDPTVSDSSDKRYIIGSDIVRSKGGEVATIQLSEGFSTTSIVNRIKNE